jgi:hypothetical protein
MAALALLGIGAPAQTAGDYLTNYQKRLEPIEQAPVGYRDDLAEMREAVRALGSERVLARELPALISGWARDAYHPLIRIAYGYQFGIPEEVAAGLAYLKWCGADHTLERLAGDIQERDQGPASLFAAVRACATPVTATRNFNACLNEVSMNPRFAAGAALCPYPLRAASTEALRIFAGTHDFFALHLVTGAHAYRVLYPLAGPRRDQLFMLGLLAGYAAVGAPPYRSTIPVREPSNDLLVAALGTDEHRIKLCFSAASQADFFADPAYRHAAAAYLGNP